MRYSIIGLGVILIASVLFAMSLAFAADETTSTAAVPMSILPAPKTVTIDGDLKEWDKSGKVGPLTFDDEVFDDYHATFYAMYDKDNLYLAAEVVEPHLPYNPYPGKGVGAWDGDGVTIRLSTIPRDAATAWPLKIDDKDTSMELYNGKFWWNHKEQVVYWEGYHGMNGKVFAKKELPYEVAVTLANDGHGYTMEMKLPFAVLNPAAPRPKPGDVIALFYSISLGSDSAAEPHRIFQIFGNCIGNGASAFTDYTAWGKAIFK